MKGLRVIRLMVEKDAEAVLHIYQQGIDSGHATFQTHAPTWEVWKAGHLEDGRWVIEEEEGQVVGWAALAAVSSRCVYGGVAEVSVYLAADARGRGMGLQLLNALIEASEQAGFWSLQAGVFPENAASLALHQRAGFRVVGTRQRLGRMSHGPLAGQWRDVVLLERRSMKVGID